MNILDRIKEISILRPKDGDVIIAKVPCTINSSHKQYLGEALKEALNEQGFMNQILVISDDIELSILRKEENECGDRTTDS